MRARSLYSGLLFRKCSILLQVTACPESTNAAHRGSKQLWVTFAKLLQPTFKTDQSNTSSIFSNIKDISKETRRTVYSQISVDQPIISAQVFPSQTGFALLCSIKTMDSFPVAINSDTSQDKASFRPSTKHSKQHNRNDCFNIGQNWTAFKSTKFFGGWLMYHSAFLSWKRTAVAGIRLVMTMHNPRCLSMICVWEIADPYLGALLVVISQFWQLI